MGDNEWSADCTWNTNFSWGVDNSGNGILDQMEMPAVRYEPSKGFIGEMWHDLLIDKDGVHCILDNDNEIYTRESRFTPILDEDDFAAVALPMIRKVFSKTIANDIVPVQPMAEPMGKLFFMMPTTSEREWDEEDYDDIELYVRPSKFQEILDDDTCGLALRWLPTLVKERKLRATWIPEKVKNIDVFCDNNAEAELTAVLSEQIAADMDKNAYLKWEKNEGALEPGMIWMPYILQDSVPLANECSIQGTTASRYLSKNIKLNKGFTFKIDD